MKWRKALLYLLLGTFLMVSFTVRGIAKSFEERSLPAKSCLVVSSAFASAPYFVSKMIYAVNGSIVAGAINLFSLGFAQDAATIVGSQAVNGDWLIYPTVFTGERKVEFIGKDEPVEVISLSMEQKE